MDNLAALRQAIENDPDYDFYSSAHCIAGNAVRLWRPDWWGPFYIHYPDARFVLMQKLGISDQQAYNLAFGVEEINFMGLTWLRTHGKAPFSDKVFRWRRLTKKISLRLLDIFEETGQIDWAEARRTA